MGSWSPPEEQLSRGYAGYPYGPVAPSYPVLPFFEPLVILAGLAFLAFIIQIFYAIYISAHQASNLSSNQGLVGGVVGSLVPTRQQPITESEQRYRDIIAAIHTYESLQRDKVKSRDASWRRNETDERGSSEALELVPVRVKDPSRKK